ncbi:PqqD family protein [Microbacterium sp. IEGM 1404]|uniref:PqqD family protein n=1 Tax=Microbacterium sp. IEGM 1404 TaxID=3047084 RepID=UPI0024B676A1|nr:PqqD family protein [Microbacterium sp. IEGM 1404]MDI9891748.1 PqqD family protein [Microbacterium sp. IEGM 1404]
MTDTAIPYRAAHVAWTAVDGCVYAVAPAGPTPFTVVELSETGSSVWMHIDGAAAVPSIVRRVADEWGVGTDDVAEGVRSFLRQLTDQHLVVWEATAPETSPPAPM